MAGTPTGPDGSSRRRPPQGGSSSAPPRPAVMESDLLNWFTYHPPGPGQPEKYEEIRAAGLAMARAVLTNTPPGADQTAAVRKIREAVFTANAAVACGGR